MDLLAHMDAVTALRWFAAAALFCVGVAATRQAFRDRRLRRDIDDALARVDETLARHMAHVKGPGRGAFMSGGG